MPLVGDRRKRERREGRAAVSWVSVGLVLGCCALRAGDELGWAGSGGLDGFGLFHFYTKTNIFSFLFSFISLDLGLQIKSSNFVKICKNRIIIF